MKLEIKEIDGVSVTGIPDGSRTVKGPIMNRPFGLQLSDSVY